MSIFGKNEHLRVSNSQRASFTRRRKQIWEAMNPVELQVGQQVAQAEPPVAKHGHAQAQGFATSTSDITGESKATINRHIARAEALGDDINEVVGTTLLSKLTRP